MHRHLTSSQRTIALIVGWMLSYPFLASAETSQRPNILFAIADDWSQEHAGAYGCQWVKTPAFDRIAREGVLFNQVFTSNPKCSPCRASILTGRNSWQLKEAVTHYSIFPTGFAVYPELLQQAGYHVGLTGKGWGPGDFKVSGYTHNPAGKEYQSVRRKKRPLDGVSSIDYASNFNEFLERRPEGQPFCFWYGAFEPHRIYDNGSGLRSGKRLKDVTVPSFLPDNNTVRSDLLDYAMEVEWFDTHLGRILARLEEIGELDNTLIIATSDHGMPFPRAKGYILEDGFHLPLAVRWGDKIQAGRTIDDFINVRDYAPTILESAGVEIHAQMSGRSFLDLLISGKSGLNDPSRSVQLIGKERHDLGRPEDAGYPVRAIRTPEFLFVRNYEPDRWPTGNPETGYRCCDDSPTKEFILSRFNKYYRMSFGKRPAEELYRIVDDPDCLHNLAGQTEYAGDKKRLQAEMENRLKQEGDPRMNGDTAFFETIQYVGPRTHAWDTWMEFQNSE